MVRLSWRDSYRWELKFQKNNTWCTELRPVMGAATQTRRRTRPPGPREGHRQARRPGRDHQGRSGPPELHLLLPPPSELRLGFSWAGPVGPSGKGDLWLLPSQGMVEKSRNFFRKWKAAWKECLLTVGRWTSPHQRLCCDPPSCPGPIPASAPRSRCQPAGLLQGGTDWEGQSNPVYREQPGFPSTCDPRWMTCPCTVLFFSSEG